MKRRRRLANQTGRVGHILFWLFPEEWDTQGVLGTPAGRELRPVTRKVASVAASGVRGRSRPASKSGHGWMLVIVSLLVLGGFVGTSCAQCANANPENQSLQLIGGGSDPSARRGANPATGESHKSPSLPGAVLPQTGDRLASDAAAGRA